MPEFPATGTNDGPNLQEYFDDYTDIWFPNNSIAVIDAYVSPDGLVMTAGSQLDLRNSEIAFKYTKMTGIAWQLSATQIQDGLIELPLNYVINRILNVQNRLSKVRVRSDVSIDNQSQSGDAAVILKNGANVSDLSIENFDVALIVHGDDIHIENLTISVFKQGMVLRNCSRLFAKNLKFIEKSARGQSKGHNAIAAAWDGTSAAHDCEFEDIYIFESGEHGIYLSRSVNVERGSRIKMSNVVVERVRYSGAKFRHYDTLFLRNFLITDCNSYTDPHSNHSGCRIEKCTNVWVDGLTVRTREKSTSGYYGLFIASSSGYFENIQLFDTHNSGLVITDRWGDPTTEDEDPGDYEFVPCGFVHAKAKIVNSGSHAILIRHESTPIGNIELDVEIDGCPANIEAIMIIAMPPVGREMIVIRGTYKNCPAGLPDYSAYPWIDISGLVPG